VCSLPIVDITKFSFQDYPEKTSCIVWFGGCNFNCPYCHNPELVFPKSKNFLKEEKVFNFLRERVGLLDGVVLSGGEVTLNDIYDFVKKIKSMGFLIKIDTNGSNPILIKHLLDDSIVDFIALDYKSPKEKFNLFTKESFDKFNETLFLVINSSIEHEIRTTIHTKILDETDINKIIEHLEDLNFKRKYAIQNFKNTKTLKEDFGEQKRIINNDLIKKTSFEIVYRNF
jgi:pyruvate formate lyase activating enzyme